MTRFHRAVVLSLFLGEITLSRLAAQSCGLMNFTPPTSGVSHQGLYLTDPSGQQKAIFDLTWGGALASLTYNGVEQIVSKNTGTMVQFALFGPPSKTIGSTTFYYNPTLAGGTGGTPLLGAACNGAYVELYGGTTDFSAGLEGGVDVGNNVWAGQLTSTLMTPYAVHYSATFVPSGNTGGGPASYLKLAYYIWNIDFVESKTFSFNATDYTLPARTTAIGYPSNCTKATQCLASSTPTLAFGNYKDSTYTDGLAVSTSPSTFFTDGGAYTYWNQHPDNPDSSYAGELWSTVWKAPPGSTPRSFVWYVLVGDWTHALAFAKAHLQ